MTLEMRLHILIENDGMPVLISYKIFYIYAFQLIVYYK